MFPHPRRNISGLGDRDSECRVSGMFEGVHPTLPHNRRRGRGHLEIAVLNEPLVSPRFTLIWPTVPPDWHSQCVNIHSQKTNKSSMRLWGGHGFKVLRFFRHKVPQSVILISQGESNHHIAAVRQASTVFPTAGSSFTNLPPSRLPPSCCNICRAARQISLRLITCHICTIHNNCNSSVWRWLSETHVCHSPFRDEGRRCHYQGELQPAADELRLVMLKYGHEH